MTRVISLLLLFIATSSAAQSFKEELRQIMTGQDFIGHWPSPPKWHVSGEYFFFEWNPNNQPAEQWYVCSIREKKPVPHDPNNPFELLAWDVSQSNYPEQFSIVNNTLVKYHKAQKKLTILYRPTQTIHTLQRHGSKVYFIQDQSLFEYNAAIGSLAVIFRTSSVSQAKRDTTYLEKQEIQLFNYHKDQNAMKVFKEKTRSTYPLPEFELPKNHEVAFIQIHPNGSDLFIGLQENVKNTATEYIDMLHPSGVATVKKARPKVGEVEPTMELWVYSLNNQSAQKVDLSQLPSIQNIPELFPGFSAEVPKDFQRKVYIHPPIFSQSGTPVLDLRTRDNKDRYLVSVENGVLKLIDHQHDDAWIGGPGIEPWDVVPGKLEWITADDLLFQSEKSGYSHLYLYNQKTQKTEALTNGQWEVHDWFFLPNELYIQANKNHPGVRNVYKLNLKNKSLVPVWEEKGAAEVVMGPSEGNYLLYHSSVSQPWEIRLFQGKNSTDITQSTTQDYKRFPRVDPALVSFTGFQSETVHARLYQPIQSAKKSAIIFIHGAGYLQNAHHYWSSYYREYLFHQLLVQQGYTVLDVDYHASEGYGRDFRTSIYRHMGGADLEDIVAAKQFLIDSLGIQPDKVGVYGGSYGGFLTLMALLKHPNQFACGAALRSVTDWTHYNHEYTSNILNLPANDSIAYQRSSPIYYADQLADPLLLLHGFVDDNVQFQDIVRFSQRLIELGKENWELAVYPIEPHGFKTSSSWYDEYRRIAELFFKYL